MRFKVGEMAMVAVDLSGKGREGSVVTILEVGPIYVRKKDGTVKKWDYKTTPVFEDEKWCYAWDIELRKIDPPAEPASLTREEEKEA